MENDAASVELERLPPPTPKNTGACNGLLYGPDTVPGDEDETASGKSR